MHWLCKVFGHKHLGGVVFVSFQKEFCQRCLAKIPEKESAGDSVMRCKIFGHKHRIDVNHDFGTDKYKADFCWNCHKTVAIGKNVYR